MNSRRQQCRCGKTCPVQRRCTEAKTSRPQVCRAGKKAPHKGPDAMHFRDFIRTSNANACMHSICHARAMHGCTCTCTWAHQVQGVQVAHGRHHALEDVAALVLGQSLGAMLVQDLLLISEARGGGGGSDRHPHSNSAMRVQCAGQAVANHTPLNAIACACACDASVVSLGSRPYGYIYAAMLVTYMAYAPCTVCS